MGPFEMIVAIVGMSFIYHMVRLKILVHERRKGDTAQSATENAALRERLDKLERRMANLETIVLESEKHRQFDRSL